MPLPLTSDDLDQIEADFLRGRDLPRLIECCRAALHLEQVHQDVLGQVREIRSAWREQQGEMRRRLRERLEAKHAGLSPNP
jgi:hypothetical protein